MNQLTTIAALPSGAGQAAHLKPEIGRARDPEPFNWFGNGMRITFTSGPNKGRVLTVVASHDIRDPRCAVNMPEPETFNLCDECETCSTCLKTGCLPVIDPDMLDASDTSEASHN